MKLTPTDIFSFDFCPYLYEKKSLPINIYPEYSFIDKTLIKSIYMTEQRCLIKEIEINTRKIIRTWDSLWWPIAIKNNISIKEAENISSKVAVLFNEYCKYDLTDIYYQTAATNILLQKEIYKNSILEWKIPILKIDISKNNKNLIIMDFGNRKLTAREIALDLEVQSKVLVASQLLKEISYVYIYIDINNYSLNMTTVIFRKEDIDNIEESINYLALGIHNKINYMNKWNCERCKQCKIFKL